MDYKEKATILRVCSSRKGERCSRCPAFGQGGRVCIRNAMKDGATAITDLLARAEAAEKGLADCREKNAGLALALLTEQPPNSDCLGDQAWQAVRNRVKEAESRVGAAEYELEQRKVYYDQMVDALAAADSKELEEANEKLKSAEDRAEKAEKKKDAAIQYMRKMFGWCTGCAHFTGIYGSGCKIGEMDTCCKENSKYLFLGEE